MSRIATIARPTATTGKIFEKAMFNDHCQTMDPFTGQALTPSLGFSLPRRPAAAIPGPHPGVRAHQLGAVLGEGGELVTPVWRQNRFMTPRVP